jgi:hypothetical protein
MPERMPAIKRILNYGWWGLPFRARASISSGDEDAWRLGEQEGSGQEFGFHR